MREQILDLIDKRLKDYDLEGVEIVEEDLNTIESLVNSKLLPIEDAVHIVLTNIREALDEGLD